MIVVLRHEIQMIDQPHRLLEPRMQLGIRKHRGLKLRYTIHQPHARFAKSRQNRTQLASIMIGFLRPAIAEVRDRERISAGEKVFHTREPERLQVEEVSGMLLCRPLISRFANQHVMRDIAQYLFQPRRRAPQPHYKIWILFDRKSELELPFKPRRNLAHWTIRFRIRPSRIIFSFSIQELLGK